MVGSLAPFKVLHLCQGQTWTATEQGTHLCPHENWTDQPPQLD